MELDHEYAVLAKGLGVSPYLRAPAVGVAAPFIDGLADMVVAAAGRSGVGAGWGSLPTGGQPLRTGGARRMLNLDQRLPHPGGDRLHGRTALSAAPVRLPLQGQGRFGDGRDLQDHGGQAPADHHHPASIAVAVLGAWLVMLDGPAILSQPWMMAKLAGVAFLYGWMAIWRGQGGLSPPASAPAPSASGG